MKVFWFAIAILMLAGGTVSAKTASETATEYFGTLQQKDYDGAAKYFDPAALGEFRQMMSFVSELGEDVQTMYYTTFFGEGATKDSVTKLSDALFFATFLRSVMAQADAAGGINFDKMEVLGEVMEGKDVAHVVTRNKVSVGEIEVEAMDVASFRKIGEEWKALMSGRLKGMPVQLKAALRRRNQQNP